LICQGARASSSIPVYEGAIRHASWLAGIRGHESFFDATVHGYTAEVLVAYLLLAAPVVAALFFWGAWGWVAAAGVVAAVQYATLQRSQRFSARVWRSVGVTQRSRRERGIETIYVISAVSGVALLIGSLLGID
jgi:hypothetical protein